LALPIPTRNYSYIISGPKGNAFIGERVPNNFSTRLHKFNLEKQELKEFAPTGACNASSVSVTANGKHMLARVNGSWNVISTSGANAKSGKKIKVNLQMKWYLVTGWSGSPGGKTSLGGTSNTV
jgi:tricorn protease